MEGMYVYVNIFECTLGDREVNLQYNKMSLLWFGGSGIS